MSMIVLSVVSDDEANSKANKPFHKTLVHDTLM